MSCRPYTTEINPDCLLWIKFYIIWILLLNILRSMDLYSLAIYIFFFFEMAQYWRQDFTRHIFLFLLFYFLEDFDKICKFKKSICVEFICVSYKILMKEIKDTNRSSHYGSVINEPTSIQEDVRLIPALAQRVKDLVLWWAVV